MYDIFLENIILTDEEDIEDKLFKYNFRFIDNNILKLIHETQNNKLISFMNNYNIDILMQTFEKYDKEYDYTTFKRPSFLYVYNTSQPYYTKKQLIYEYNNNKNNLDNNNKNKNKTIDTLYEIIKEYDITSEELLEHHVYIRKTFSDNVIKYYTFFDINKYTNYLRFPQKHHRNEYMERYINNLNNVLKESPAWKKSYYVYRWTHEDSYLRKIKVGDYFIDRSFTSSTRNPYFSIKDEYNYGYILIKIKLPKNKIGCGLSIEHFSLMEFEQEILLPPAKYKLIDNIDTVYNHIDDNVDKKILEKYELEFIEPLTNFIDYKSYLGEFKIRTFDLTVGNQTFNHFENIKVGNELLPFEIKTYAELSQGKDLFYLDETKLKYIFLLLDDKSNIILLIEIGDIISVNYYSKYCGYDTTLIGDYTFKDLIILFKNIANYFNIQKIIIHPNHTAYINIINIDSNAYYLTNNFKKIYFSDMSYYSNLLLLYINRYLKQKNEQQIVGLTEYLFLENDTFDKLFNTLINTKMKTIIKILDNDELLEISYNFKNKNLIDFYIHILKNNYYLIPLLHQNIYRILNIDLDNLSFESIK
jgi:hypothetical protein